MHRSTVALVLALAGLATARPAHAETAEAFVHRAASELAAARPSSEVVTTDITTLGMTGRALEIRRGDDEVYTEHLGPFTTASGVTGGDAWHQNENGITVRDETTPSDRAATPKRMTLERVRAPRDLWLVTATHADGRIERTYYDPTDLVVVRRAISRGTHALTVDYGDLRPWSGGKRRAWRTVGRDDRGNTFTAAVVSDDVAPIATDPAFASGFAVPPDRRTLVEFPDVVNQVTLPASVELGRIHVHVEVDGNPLTFVLDTGASGIILDAQAAKDMSLRSYGTRALTVAGTFASSKVIAPSMRVGTLTLRDVVMSTAPIDQREGTARVDGLLGFDFIAGAILRIDYIDPGQVVAIRPAIFTAPPLATSTMPIRLNAQVPMVHVGVGDASSDAMIVDTGAEAPVLFFDRFVRAHPAAVADLGFDGPYDPSVDLVPGVGGRVAIVPLRIASFRFADLEFKNYIVLRARDPGAFGDVRDDGLLGALFLRFYTLYIDYPGRKLYFEPNENYTRGVGKPLRL